MEDPFNGNILVSNCVNTWNNSLPFIWDGVVRRAWSAARALQPWPICRLRRDQYVVFAVTNMSYLLFYCDQYVVIAVANMLSSLWPICCLCCDQYVVFAMTNIFSLQWPICCLHHDQYEFPLNSTPNVSQILENPPQASALQFVCLYQIICFPLFSV